MLRDAPTIAPTARAIAQVRAAPLARQRPAVRRGPRTVTALRSAGGRLVVLPACAPARA